ncbi:uncharacterized protein MICPUCDRAFT_57489 [Micromonas pusilla CCMP1545]|jgi:RNA-binding protein Luc7-like 2|uniref:Predicted protein n=1 Tax=Micromonas pusilla (strain CCMP1545) TaxID=564608 RepID=C1MR16_MICPC|nr:uncharacterized protein MICPUCDRAFT_57489 [Micromonas pusilla CCMP1545]EEH57802.1 predicted protein [Micromonas pusilla CCMP1545]|eukprot:XP_003057851.1 predicted protein [Micromonas pusilla CCMP1545]
MGWGNKGAMGKDPNDPAALLDQLMGSARNLTDDQKAVVKPPWETSDCCPHFLAGCCPNFMFSYAQKRSDLPTCAYAVHDDAIALDYRRANLPTLPKYEQRLLDKLRILVDGMDERIAKAVARVKAEMVVSDPRTVTAIAELSAKIAALVAAAEKAGDDGDVETAEKAMAEADELAKLKKPLEERLKENEAINEAAAKVTGTMYGEQEVCDVCCSITNAKDELNCERHREGQMHMGWTKIRETLKRLDEKYPNAGGGGGGGGGELREQKDDVDAEEGEVKGEAPPRRRERSRSRDRYRRDDRDRDRDGRRDRRSRSRSRDRYRPYDRDGGGRDRSRDRDRDRGGYYRR